MDINDAVSTVEKFLESFKSDDWAPTEMRILPSGDDKNAIKIWFNFGPDREDADLAALKDKAVKALSEAHADIAASYTFEVRADAM